MTEPNSAAVSSEVAQDKRSRKAKYNQRRNAAKKQAKAQQKEATPNASLSDIEKREKARLKKMQKRRRKWLAARPGQVVRELFGDPALAEQSLPLTDIDDPNILSDVAYTGLSIAEPEAGPSNAGGLDGSAYVEDQPDVLLQPDPASAAMPTAATGESPPVIKGAPFKSVDWDYDLLWLDTTKRFLSGLGAPVDDLRVEADEERAAKRLQKAEQQYRVYDGMPSQHLKDSIAQRGACSCMKTRGGDHCSDPIACLEKADKATSFPKFMDLAPELRNRIYEFAFADISPLTQCLMRPKQPAITKVSRQVRHESLSLFYETQYFVLNLVLEDLPDFDWTRRRRQSEAQVQARAAANPHDPWAFCTVPMDGEDGSSCRSANGERFLHREFTMCRETGTEVVVTTLDLTFKPIIAYVDSVEYFVTHNSRFGGLWKREQKSPGTYSEDQIERSVWDALKWLNSPSTYYLDADSLMVLAEACNGHDHTQYTRDDSA